MAYNGGMLADLPVPELPRIESAEERNAAIRRACERQSDFAHCDVIGHSEEGRPILGVVLGHGPCAISLIAGAHADEPIGPMTLRLMVTQMLEKPEVYQRLLHRCCFVIVPHVNPDGEAANRPWIDHWPDPVAYLRHVQREKPGRDIEFGYPDLRIENHHVASFLDGHGPMAMHASLHGMAAAEGGQLLIERHWIDRTRELRRAFGRTMTAAGMPMMDWDRAGEKGFWYISPGFMTTPEGAAMREHFRREGDDETAKLFRDSSMEYVRRLGGDPLCLVTELPLFLLTKKVAAGEPGLPATFLALRRVLPEIKRTAEEGKSVDADLRRFGVEPVDGATLVRLQLTGIALGMAGSCA